jgi:CheY-like chemotaxis protein
VPPSKVFLIEDDDLIAWTTQWRLQKLGYTLSGRAANGQDALAKITANPPDVVLIDVNIAGAMDGISVAEHLNGNTRIPFIFITALSDDPTLSRAKATKPSGFLVKPFEDRNLRAAIEMAVK